jgi:fibronectin-binding autotransporter adhesin
VLSIANGSGLNLDSGSYAQLGNVTLNSSGNVTQLVIGGNVTLSGGTVTMSGNTQNYIFGAAANDVLTNAETIQGAGNIGNGVMGLVNSGTIIANASGNMVINVSSMNFNNTGTVEANGANLTIQGPGVTFLTNDNQSTGTLTGGTYIASGGNISWNGGVNAIGTLAANVTEQGGGQMINTYNSGSTNMLAGLTSITSAGSLTIGGVTFNDAGAFSNAGSLTLLGSESFSVGSLAQISGGSLTAGTYVLNSNLNLTGTAQTITTNAATLTLAGGTIENTSNSTNALAGLATNSGKLTIAGTSNNVSTTAATFNNTGSLTINGGDSFTASKLTQISGTTLGAGTYALSGNLNLTTSGINVTTNSATLTLSGGTINSGGVNALAGLASNTKSLTIAGTGNNVSTSAATFSNAGSLTINTGDSFTAAKLTQISGTTLGAGTYVLGGNLDLTTAVSVTTNAATLTLDGGAIQTGSTNDLANLSANTKSLTIANNAGFTTGASFTNTGAVAVAAGSTFTVNGSSGYKQTAGTTTIDGTLASSGGTTVSGGTLLGAGAIGGNVSNSAAINVGDSGKAGLLSITGSYTQLSSGTLSASVGGTAAGTLYSQLKISGTASLGGTLSAALINKFTPTIGQTFTILTATGGFGATTFTNSTIAINSSEQFDISYTSTSVVLTVASTSPSKSNTSNQPSSQMVAALPVQPGKGTALNATNSLRKAVGSGISRRVQLASIGAGGRKVLSAAATPSATRIWEHIPATPSWDHVRAVMVAQAPAAGNIGGMRSNLVHAIDIAHEITKTGISMPGISHAVPVRAPLSGWSSAPIKHMPLHILPPPLPVIR